MKPLHVALPLGIGDVHWVCTKLRGLSEHHGGRPIHAHVSKSPNHASVGYLKLVPQIAKAYEDSRAPYNIVSELKPGGYQDKRWATLEGSANWNGFDYVLVANGHLERGEPLATYLPELETEHSYPLDIGAEDVQYAHGLAPPGSILLYPSGTGPNFGFHRHTWTRAHWARTVHLLNEAGVEPVLVGANTPDDLTYCQRVVQAMSGARYEDAVGKTSIPQIMAMIRDAGTWCGLNSGLGIVSAMLGTPTVMLWADRRYPTDGDVLFDPRMHRSWLTDDQCETYRTFSFGSPELTPEDVVHAILEVCRARKAVAA